MDLCSSKGVYFFQDFGILVDGMRHTRVQPFFNLVDWQISFVVRRLIGILWNLAEVVPSNWHTGVFCYVPIM
jgi:hypothetical protein